MIRIAVLLSIIFLLSSSTVIYAASIISPRSFEPDPNRLRQINAEGPPLSDPELPDSCLDVLEQLMPCLDYLIDDDDKPSEDCCSGAKEVVNDNKTKQETCRCLKAVLRGFDSRRFSQISEQCGLSLALPRIDATFDCSRLKVIIHFMFFFPQYLVCLISMHAVKSTNPFFFMQD